MRATIMVSAVLIGALGSASGSAIVGSDIGVGMKVIDVLSVVAMMTMGAIRIWIASRPHGNPKSLPEPIDELSGQSDAYKASMSSP